MIEFDLGVIPAGAVITEVTLNLGTENGGNNSDGVIDILSVTREWGEGTSSGSGTGAPAVAPDATWTDAMLGTSFWTNPGGDFAELLSSRFTTEEFQPITFPSSPNFVARAQTWLDDPSMNHGLLIQGVESANCAALRLGSKDLGVSPELVVTWTSACNNPVSNIMIEACETFTSPNGTIFTNSAMFTEIIPGPNGCDTILNIDLTILTPFEVLVNNTICDDDTFTLDGNVFDINNPSGTVIFPSTTGGCDSVYTIDLSFAPAVNSSINEEICADNSFSIVVGGTIFDIDNPSGFVELISASGCDSIVTVNLTFFPGSDSEIILVGCEGDGTSVTVGSTVFDESNPSGLEVLVGADVNGCDSTVAVNLIFNPSGTSSMEIMTCDLSTPPTTTEVIPNGSFNGCDSIVIITAIFLPNDETEIMLSSCNPDDVGVEVIVLTNTSGCDSTVTITTSLLPSDETEVMLGSCNPDDVGVVVVNLINVNGCDSTVTITTSLLPSDETEIMAGSCNPDDVGVVVLDLTNANGCDSIVTITTTLLPSDETEIMAGSCNPDDVGVVVVTLTNANGCDSIVTITTSLLPSDETNIMLSSCNPDDVGVVVVDLINGFGCDSTVTTTTTLLPSDETTFFEVACNPIDTGTTITNLNNQFGCDSLIITITEFEPLDNSVTISDGTITASLPGGNYQWIDCDNNNEPITGETGQSFTPSVSGNYAVMIAMIGCTTVTSDCFNITVVRTEEVWFSNQLSVMPNPTNGDFRLTFGALEDVKVKIMDVTGKILLEQNNLNGGFEDFLIEGAAGLYFVGVEVEGVTGWMRVVKN